MEKIRVNKAANEKLFISAYRGDIEDLEKDLRRT